jgi:hypothetical protein
VSAVRSPRRTLRVWRVIVAPHQVERWEIPATTARVVAADATHACEITVRNLHRDIGVPPWRPCLRRSLEHATATQTRSPHA